MPISQRTSAAQRDLESIAFDIGVVHRRPTIADRMIDELIGQRDRLAELASTAILGTAAPEIGPHVRLFPYKRWVIIFRYETDCVTILRIVDASQDYMSWRLA